MFFHYYYMSCGSRLNIIILCRYYRCVYITKTTRGATNYLRLPITRRTLFRCNWVISRLFEPKSNRFVPKNNTSEVMYWPTAVAYEYSNNVTITCNLATRIVRLRKDSARGTRSCPLTFDGRPGFATVFMKKFRKKKSYQILKPVLLSKKKKKKPIPYYYYYYQWSVRRTTILCYILVRVTCDRDT